ncbi:hypothetical protein DPMN_150725 [Dreissena polymorpha]|uniref:Uncharacterized protein n=1 Tax=Dreissena polymorpha TaxID=45954 RepID=A0A9D4J3L3_DREPO|nr:hypothetical protein DPMN_150725 [Dreissena polymorpha]
MVDQCNAMRRSISLAAVSSSYHCDTVTHGQFSYHCDMVTHRQFQQSLGYGNLPSVLAITELWALMVSSSNHWDVVTHGQFEQSLWYGRSP